jgi:uncharacterized protein YjdB
MRNPRVWIWLGLGLPMLAGCEGPMRFDQCFIRLAVVTPDPATLMVEQEVTLEAHITPASGCLPSDAKPGSLRWASENPGIATIDPTSGRVKAVSPGTAQVSLTTATTHTLLTTSTIHVIP